MKQAALFDDPTICPPDADVDSDDWYTPVNYIEAARQALGSIDLDPASCFIAQRVVQAGRFYTEEENGLLLPWFGRVWCNPPYSRGLIDRFAARAVEQYRTGRCEAIVMLTNNSTDTEWCRLLGTHAYVMFTHGRIPFWGPRKRDDKRDNNSRGQALFYFGPDTQRFHDAFAALAWRPR